MNPVFFVVFVLFCIIVPTHQSADRHLARFVLHTLCSGSSSRPNNRGSNVTASVPLLGFGYADFTVRPRQHKEITLPSVHSLLPPIPPIPPAPLFSFFLSLPAPPPSPFTCVHTFERPLAPAFPSLLLPIPHHPPAAPASSPASIPVDAGVVQCSATPPAFLQRDSHGP